MHFTVARFVAALASVGLVTSTALPQLAGDNARSVSGGCDASVDGGCIAGDVNTGSVSNAVYVDDDFVGTPEEIYIKVKARYDSVVSLEKRNQIFPPLCIPVANWPWKKAAVYAANSCREQMLAWGRAYIGPNSCERACCVDGSQVWICNDNSFGINPALPYIQTYVGAIVDACTTSNTVAGPLAGGQMFDTDSYNVILRGENGLATDCDFTP